MADWALPTLADLKVDVLGMLKSREVDAYTLAENPINPPVGAKRYNHSLNLFQAWDGASWVNLIVSIEGGGTGASDINGFLDNFNLGSMALQESNNVKITAGYIHGLGGGNPANPIGLEVLTNAYLKGVNFAGSAPTQITNSAGQILEGAIADEAILARVAANETITGAWKFTTSISSAYLDINNAYPQLWLIDTDSTTLEQRNLRIMYNNGQITFTRYRADNLQALTWITSDGNSGSAGTTVANGHWTFGYPTTTIGDGATGYLYCSGNAPGTKGMIFSSGGQVISTGGVLYLDQDTIRFRLVNGTTLGGFYSGGFFSEGSIRSANGSFIYPDGVGNFMHIAGANLNFFVDTYQFINKANGYYIAKLDAVGTLELSRGDSSICIGGPPGTGVRIYHTGANAFFCTHQAGGATYWYDALGGTHLATLDGSGSFHSPGGSILPSGSGGTPAMRFAGSLHSGAFYSPQHPAIEWGSNSPNANRAVMRTFTNQPLLDIIVGDAARNAIFGPNYCNLGYDSSAHVIGTREIRPFVHHANNCGYPGQAWFAVYSANPLQITSDVNSKDIHGPLVDALDVVDSVDTFIASFKESLKPKDIEPGAGARWARKFPSFSAQELRDKIDNKYGTGIVDDENPDQLSAAHERLLPIMWQAIKELLARVKALEP